ncbi:MAG TPA: MBL fold metallo-hydrolase [candidate division Zixibacteria bacterium]|nr:MBL fold metallo-hydrolase [candidate division Zixibacteria bacterium]
MFEAPGYDGPVSDHFNGRQFINRDPVEQQGFSSLFKFLFLTTRDKWPAWTENKTYPKPPERVGEGELQATFINHSTVLLQMDGLNFLTDPIFSERCSPLSWFGPKRKRAPGLSIGELPQIDYLLVSHNHYDHMDLPSLRELVRLNPQVHLITSLGNQKFLERELPGVQIDEMDWQDKMDLRGGMTLYGLPAQHFSGRGTKDRQKTLWMSFLISGPAGNVYFAADSGFGSHFEEIGNRFGPIRLALIPIGAYMPKWFMRGVHISPEEAVQAHLLLKAETSIAIHFGTFQLGADGQYRPVEELEVAKDTIGESRPRFWALDFGESRAISAVAQAPAPPVTDRERS